MLQSYEENPNYIHGLQGMSVRELPHLVDQFYTPYVKGELQDSDVLHKASISGYLNMFIDRLKERHCIVIGPKRLIKLLNYFDFDLIVVPDVNCWGANQKIEREIRKEIADDKVLLYSASMMSNVLIDRIWKDYGDSITQIDCGSVWEPYVGHFNRSYHKKINP